MAMKYFLFSSQQLDFRREIEKKMGKTFNPGQVIVNGARVSFTEISTENSSKRYSDAKVVAYGDTDKLKYTLPG